MTGVHWEKQRAWRMTAQFVAVLIIWGGLSYGWGQTDPNPAACPEESGPGLDENPRASVQIEPGSELARKIEHKRRIKILTLTGEKEIRWPVILSEGLVSGTTISGEKIISGGYNQSTFLPWNDIRAIQIRKSYAAIGALAGVAAGIVISMERDASGGYLLRGPLYGLAGAIVGSMIPRWKTVYSEMPKSLPVPTIAITPIRSGGMSASLSVSF